MTNVNILKIRDEKVKEKTGKAWAGWFRILDQWNAKKHGHTETAKHLVARYEVSSWWAQVVTIRYEKENGYWKKQY